MGSVVYKKKWPLLVFLIPAFAFMIVFLYYPFVQNIINSVYSIQGQGSAATALNNPWYENYVKIFTDPNMRIALKNTFIVMAATVVIQLGIALVLAIIVDNIKKGAKLFRTVFFFPIVISATALGLLFNLIFLYDTGMINQLLMNTGLITGLIDWKATTRFMFTMLFPILWQYVGFYFVIIVTGLNNISGEVYEAAAIDGATGFQKVRFISLPLLHNTLLTCLTLAVTGSLKVFDMPNIMFPNGMPFDQSWLTSTYMNYQTFFLGDVDYASTIAIVIVVLGVTIAQLLNHFLKPRDY